jgi:hypothetical protein
MKKMIIGALVGSIILFIWQFLSWSLINIHSSQMQHTDKQDVILEVLNENLDEGSYFLPNLPPGATAEESAAYMKESEGKPWAIISYHKEMTNNMGMSMFRGWAVDFISAWLLCWILLQYASRTFSNTLLTALAVGMIGYLTINYLNSIWFENNTIPDLIDAVVGWGLVGAWLGWWLNR